MCSTCSSNSKDDPLSFPQCGLIYFNYFLYNLLFATETRKEFSFKNENLLIKGIKAKTDERDDAKSVRANTWSGTCALPESRDESVWLIIPSISFVKMIPRNWKSLRIDTDCHKEVIYLPPKKHVFFLHVS